MPVYRDQFSPKVHSTGKKIILMLFSSTSQNKSDAIDDAMLNFNSIMIPHVYI